MKYVLLYILYIMYCLPAIAADKVPIRFTLLGAEVGEDDSVSVRLRIHLHDLRVPASRSLVLEPCIENGGEGKRLVLPVVVVSGRRRALYDDRRQAVSPSPDYVRPYTRIVNPRKGRDYEVAYTVRFPYTPWMRGAGLVLNQSAHDCCHSRLLSTDRLTANLGLVPPCVKESSAPADRALRAYAAYSRDIRFAISEDEPVKLRTTTGVIYIDYRQGSAKIDPRYGSNPWELADADSLFLRLRRSGVTTFRQVGITGYASPEGAYQDNERLARLRAEGFKRYVTDRYDLSACPVSCTWVAEDWDELRRLIDDDGLEAKEQVFALIDSCGIFAGRESRLMELQGGKVYKELLSDFFPRLRRVEIRATYELPAFSDAAAAELLYTHPEQLSLAEMYRIARYYPPATEQHREVYVIAARTYPSSVAAQINAAAASLLLGDGATARTFLEQEAVQADRRAAACRRVLRQLMVDETIEGEALETESTTLQTTEP